MKKLNLPARGLTESNFGKLMEKNGRHKHVRQQMAGSKRQ